MADAWELETTGIAEDEAGTRIFFEARSSLDKLRDAHPSLVLDVRRESEHDWGTPSRADWEPLLIGKSLFVASPWVDVETPPGRHRLNIESRMAFGTGRHETTQLILEALEAQSLAGQTVVDVGCGSGILAAAATVWGAQRVVACDTDEDAVNEANLLVPGAVVQSSADAIETGIADVVVANLTAPLIDALAWELNRICKPDGILILSGFLSDRLPMAFKPDLETIKNDWQGWVVRPRTQMRERSPLDFRRPWWLNV